MKIDGKVIETKDPYKIALPTSGTPLVWIGLFNLGTQTKPGMWGLLVGPGPEVPFSGWPLLFGYTSIARVLVVRLGTARQPCVQLPAASQAHPTIVVVPLPSSGFATVQLFMS